MEFPGGANSDHLFWFGDGPHSHGLNPFDAFSYTKPRFALSHNYQDSPDATGIGYNNAFNVKTVAQRAPVLMAGWGYDLMGRPAPNHHRNLQDLNTKTGGFEDINWYTEDSNWFDDNRVFPTEGGFATKSSFPFGGDAAPARYVGGALDVRYDPRHGLWRTNHFILAEILGHTARAGASSSTYYREYEWREVEIGYVYGDDPFRRSQGPFCPASCQPDPLDHPARSFSYTDNDNQVQVFNHAMNLSEVGYDTANGPRPILGPAVASGTVVQLRSVNSIYGAPEGNPTAVFGPSYIFSHAVPHKIFVEIESNFALQLPLDAAPDEHLEPGKEDIGLYDNPTTRWYYTGKPKRWRGWPDITEEAETSPGETASERFCQFGDFVDDNNVPNESIRLINITEWNNPLARDGRGQYNHVVSPGVNMGKDEAVAYPSGFTIRPICEGTIVEAYYMPDQHVPDEVAFSTAAPRPLFYFSLANAHAGCCDTGNVGGSPSEPTDSITAGRCISVEGYSEGAAASTRPSPDSRKS